MPFYKKKGSFPGLKHFFDFIFGTSLLELFNQAQHGHD
jgi:hypothetical protein